MEAKVEAWVAQFDKLVALHESVSATDRNGCARLVMRSVPERRIFPRVDHTMGLVDPGLVAVFRQLATGQAAWPLYLHGFVGVGKTLAALCLADFSDTATYWTIDALCDFVMAKAAGEVNCEWDRLGKKDLVILDEIGQREKVGDLHASTLQKFLDTREHHADGVGIYVSNVEPKQLGQLYDDRVISRLLAGTIHHLKGPDRRQT